jgi:hypothetical protein
VWEWDYEKNRRMLMIDADPMMLMNDPKLTEVIEGLQAGGGSSGILGKGKNTTKEVIEFFGYIIVKLCEILIEILL